MPLQAVPVVGAGLALLGRHPAEVRLGGGETPGALDVTVNGAVPGLPGEASAGLP